MTTRLFARTKFIALTYVCARMLCLPSASRRQTLATQAAHWKGSATADKRRKLSEVLMFAEASECLRKSFVSHD